MEIKDLVDIFVNNGVSIAVIAYFCVRDWKFQSTLQQTLTTLVNTIDMLRDTIGGR